MDIPPEPNISHMTCEKIIEKMARAICRADGFPEDELVAGGVVMMPGWRIHETRARRHYVMHKVMMEAIGDENTKLREALEFYKAAGSYDVDVDAGDRAREALGDPK